MVLWCTDTLRLPIDRERRLSPAKVAKYTANIDAIVALADSTRKRLVPKTDMQQILGRCIFAMQAGIPALRGDIQILLSQLSGRWSRQFLCLGREAADMLRHIWWRLLHENGCACLLGRLCFTEQRVQRGAVCH